MVRFKTLNDQIFSGQTLHGEQYLIITEDVANALNQAKLGKNVVLLRSVQQWHVP